ncbi:MAG TPA: hypothetical protein VFD30_07215 [Terriglobia bacterium]|nr:hypothetical protein [Terriglobia bacterium]
MSISRRKFFRASASAAGAGFLLNTGLSKPLLAAEETHRACPALPQPIPHTIATPFGTTIHHFFPGPVEGVDANTGHDPSEIFDFRGIVAQSDLSLSGTGTDLNTGDSADYGFHTDMRFMAGHFRGTDGQTHKGAFAFI